MTPARRKALQWFHDRGEVSLPISAHKPEWMTEHMLARIIRSGEVDIDIGGWSLTDKGRRMLHGDDK